MRLYSNMPLLSVSWPCMASLYQRQNSIASVFSLGVSCERHFDHAGNLHQHQKGCTNKTKFVYPGGFHQDRENIFERLDQYEIHVPENECTFPWYICYDYEALLQKIHDQPTDMLQWTHKHVPVSVSICSNVKGHTVYLVSSDVDVKCKVHISTLKMWT